MNPISNIVIRGPPPPYVKVQVMGRGGNLGRSDFPTKESFYSLARPNNPDRTPLTPQEKTLAIETIQLAEDVGIQIGTTQRRLVWKEAADVGFGQKYPRNSDQLSMNTPPHKYPAICTFPDCFSVSGTRTEEIQPLCLAHKGPNTGYAVLEYQELDQQGQETSISHLFVKYNYAHGLQMMHLNMAMFQRNKPSGQETHRQLFDIEVDALQCLAVWQTATMFRCLMDPTLKNNSKSVSLANGLEQELEEELQRLGIRIQAIPNGPGPLPASPFGTPARPGSRMRDLVTATHGVLYSCCDSQVNYGGQTKSINRSRPGHADDTVVKYRTQNNILHPMTKIPVAVVPRTELLQMEQEFILCNYLAYLLGFQNPFDPQFAATTPYCLNLALNPSLFNATTWTRVNQFMQMKFGFRVELMAYF